MNSFFFIPANKINNLEKIKNLNPENIIIDFEDSIKKSQQLKYFEEFIQIKNNKDYYVRVPIDKENLLLKKMVEINHEKIMLPKIESYKHFKKIFSLIDNKKIKLILLIENVTFLAELEKTLKKYKKNVEFVALGSHDFVKELGAKHTLQNIEYPRQKMLYAAQMFSINAIDIASMELNDNTAFNNEVQDGFDKGYRYKFIIHPWQLTQLKSIVFYNEEEVNWAKTVIKEVNRVGGKEEFNAIKINNQIIEKPHIKKAYQILKANETK